MTVSSNYYENIDPSDFSRRSIDSSSNININKTINNINNINKNNINIINNKINNNNNINKIYNYLFNFFGFLT